MRMELPEHVREIIRKLENQGFEAYAVGGCVRDTLLGRLPGDWDITTSAKPQQIKAIDLSENSGYRNPAWNRDGADGSYRL